MDAGGTGTGGAVAGETSPVVAPDHTPAPGGTGRSLEGRVVIVTGAGRGIGREHALLFAREGASVVVNDTGRGPRGDGEHPAPGAPGPAGEVVEEIRASGGEAVANTDDVTDWDAGEHLVRSTVETYGRLDALVNNAGVLRDRALVKMTEEDWDVVVGVHLKGHFVTLRHAAVYWREEAKRGEPVAASVVNTTSTSGLYGNPGQANYGAAKAGIAALSVIAAQELARYGVRVNVIAPAARTRLTEATPGLDEIVKAPSGASRFDEWDPANVAPLAAWLAAEGCEVTGRAFYVFGGSIQLLTGWSTEPGISKMGRWSIPELARALPELLAAS